MCISRFIRVTCPRDVFDSFRPILIVFLLLGIMPYGLVGSRGKQHRLKFTIFGGLITCVYIVGFCISYVFTVREQHIFLAHIVPDMFTRIVDLFMVTFTLSAVLAMLAGCLRRKERLVGLMNVLAGIDERLIDLGGRVRHGRTMWLLCVNLVISWIVFAVYVQLSRQIFYRLQLDAAALNSWISYFMPHLMMNCFLFKWTMVSRMLHHRFDVLNIVSFVGKFFLRCSS